MELLGFGFDVIKGSRNSNETTENWTSKNKFDIISGDLAVDNLISRLNECVRVISTLRKVSSDISLKMDAATKCVWNCCYDIGLVYAYASKNKFEKVTTCIKKVLKAAGLDQLTDSNVITGAYSLF